MDGNIKVSKEEYIEWKKIVVDSSFLNDIINGKNLIKRIRKIYNSFNLLSFIKDIISGIVRGIILKTYINPNKLS